ncbi:MAG: type II/IV secretion system protein [Deltaproteobacteria bacterium]|nr:type II/IV secretion system protein [Deltaproteobacteria bacterium]
MSRPPKLTLEHLLDLLMEAQAIDASTKRDVLSKEDVLRAKFLRNKFGPQGSRRKDYRVSPSEIVDTVQIPHPDAPGRTIDEDILAQLLAQATSTPYKKIDPLELDMGLITRSLPKGFARRHLILPLSQRGSSLTVAIADPYDTHALEEYARATGQNVDVVVSSKRDIVNVITQVYGFRQAVSGAAADASAGVNLQNLEQLVRVRSSDEIDPGDQKIVAAVEYLLNAAFENRASDIHIEPKRDVTKLRLRIDGVLHDIGEIPSAVHPAFVARIKILARMDIAEKRRPQDGRIKTQKGEREIELRVSSLPVAFGEKVVIRIFDPQVLLADVVDLGFTTKERDLFEQWISRPHGLVLVTGPTGSGKTTTLYSTLKYLARPDVNIVTVEDPIEMVYEPLNQVAVQTKIDVTFASALRTILRQDPDIVMVGEIRDRETASMTVQAALTGHLVFSTLHTNDTAGSISRLLDLGVEPFMLASVLTGIVAQRLVRRVCSECAVQSYLSDEQIVTLGIPVEPGEKRKLPVKRGEGCVRCRNTGLFGRTGIFEMLDVSPKIRKLVAEMKDSKEIHKAAVLDGMTPLRQAAIRKLAQGVTTYEEIFRVTAETEV